MKIKKMFIFIMLACLFAAIFISGKNAVARIILIKAARQMVGLDVIVRGVDLGLRKTYINIDNLYVSNPAGFGDAIMADAPKVYIDYDLAAFLRGKVHLEKVRLDLREFVVVRNAAGNLNINSISGISGPRESAAGIKRAKSPMPEIKIDVLELRVANVVYKDYTQAPVMIQEFPVNIDERYENITDIDKFVKLIVTRALINTAISKLQDLNFIKLKDDISGFIQKGKSIFQGAGSPEEVVGAIQDITKQLEDIFK